MKSSDLRLLLRRRGSRRILFAAIPAALAWSALVISGAVVLGNTVVAIIEKDKNRVVLVVVLSIILITKALYQSSFDWWCSRQAIVVKKSIRQEVSGQLENYSHISPSIISTLLVKGLNSLDIYLGKFLPQLFFATIVPIAVIITMMLLDPLSAVIAIITVPLLPMFGALIGMYTADSVAKKWRTLGALSSYFEDSLRGFVTLKIFGRHRSQGSRIQSMGDEYNVETMKVLKISFLSALALELCATISVALIAVSVGLRLVSGSMEFSTALVVLVLAPEVYFPIRNIASLFHASADGSQAIATFQEVQAEINVAPAQLIVDFSTVEKISWQSWGLGGSHSSQLSQQSLNTGEIHFIVGDSGVGKSTFALNLLGIRHDATVEITTLTGQYLLAPALTQEWFKVIGWVPQFPILAAATLRTQFQLLSPEITDSEILDALLRCGLDVRDLPRGLATQCGGSGENTMAASGGQIRKIAMARALVRNPVFLVTDEPTADLDSESSEKIMQTLRNHAASGAIVICITHDLSIVDHHDSQQRFLTQVSS